MREVYSELAYDKVSLAYTEYALSLGPEKLDEIMQKCGIAEISVDFVAVMNGKDKNMNNPASVSLLSGVRKP